MEAGGGGVEAGGGALDRREATASSAAAAAAIGAATAAAAAADAAPPPPPSELTFWVVTSLFLVCSVGARRCLPQSTAAFSLTAASPCVGIALVVTDLGPVPSAVGVIW